MNNGNAYNLLEQICVKYEADKYEAFTKLQEEEHAIHFKTNMPYTTTYYYMALSRVANYYKQKLEEKNGN